MPPKAVKAPPAPAPSPNMDLVQSILAKARATAAKRKVDGMESTSPATKAKATAVPPPVVPKLSPAAPPAGRNDMAPPPVPPAKAIAPQAPISNSTEASSPVPKTAAAAPPPPTAKLQHVVKAPAAHDAPVLKTPPPKATLQKAHTPEALQTPPPKHAFASPSPAKTVRSDSWQSDRWNSWDSADPTKDDDWWLSCNSQKEYYGRQGLSWWRDYDDLGPYAPGNWLWDSWHNRYVFTHGSDSWVSKSWDMDDADLSTPSGPETPVVPSGNDTMESDANGADSDTAHVRDALACRKPSTPNVSSPEAPENAVAPTVPAKPADSL